MNHVKHSLAIESVIGSNVPTLKSNPSSDLCGGDVTMDDKNPFCMLIKAARLDNPGQFELSKDIACTTLLPGMSQFFEHHC